MKGWQSKNSHLATWWRSFLICKKLLYKSHNENTSWSSTNSNAWISFFRCCYIYIQATEPAFTKHLSFVNCNYVWVFERPLLWLTSQMHCELSVASQNGSFCFNQSQQSRLIPKRLNRWIASDSQKDMYDCWRLPELSSYQTFSIKQLTLWNRFNLLRFRHQNYLFRFRKDHGLG